MKATYYLTLRDHVIACGFGQEIDWAESVKPCVSPVLFAREYVWVVLNSGMKNQIARQIADRVVPALISRVPVSSVFGHKGKAAAIEEVWKHRSLYFWEYWSARHKIDYLRTLPWIGKITCWHLAKNLGFDVAKPDRHLVRIAKHYGKTPHELCERLSRETGDRIATVDLVLWRAANLGII